MTSPDPTSLLRIEISSSPETVDVHLIGEMDLSTRGQLRTALRRAPLDGAATVRLDLGRLEFCDVAGLAELIDAREVLARQHRVCTAQDPRPLVRRLLEVTGVRDLLDQPEDAQPARVR
jgi:anti-sigma B factor antagonist